MSEDERPIKIIKIGEKNLLRNSSKSGLKISTSHPIKKSFFVVLASVFLNLSIKLRHLIKFGLLIS